MDNRFKELLRPVLEYEVEDWAHDRFKILSQISLCLKNAGESDFVLQLGRLCIYNYVSDSEFIDCLSKLAISTSENNSQLFFYYVDEIKRFIYKESDTTLRLSFNDKLELLLEEILSIQNKYKTGIIFVHKDRGENLNYHQKFCFDIETLMNNILSKENWSIKSSYKDWLLYEATGNNFLFLEKLLGICNQSIYDKVPIMKESYLECYGSLYALFVILEQNRLGVVKLESEVDILHRLYLCFSIYRRYHIGKNALNDSEIYANMGRVARFCKKSLVVAITNSGLSNPLPQYLHMYFFLMASRLAPIETGLKYDYHATAFMMHQNQTVDGVTGDAYEIPWNDVEIVIGNYVEMMCNYSERRYLIEKYDEYQKVSLKSSAKDSIYRDRKPNEQVRLFDIYNQLEDYSKVGFRKEPFMPFYFSVADFLANIGEEHYTITDERESFDTELCDGRIFVECSNLFYFGEHSFDGVPIYMMNIGIDKNRNLTDICLYVGGMPKEKFEMLSDIKKKRTLFGIPFFPMTLMEPNNLMSHFTLRTLFRNEFDFGVDMVK